jgi:hypothetical protein
MPAQRRVLVHNCAESAIQRIYEANPKHGASPYSDSLGRVESRSSMGDGQSILDNSTAIEGSGNRLGIEPETGLDVILRRHLIQEFDDGSITEYYHGYVPGG